MGFKYDLNRYLAARGDRVPVKNLAEIVKSGRFHPNNQRRLETAEKGPENGPDSPACRADKAAVCWQALGKLKELLASASRTDQVIEEAQRLEGGADAKDTGSTTRSVGILSSVSQDAHVGRVACGGKAKDDRVAVAIAAPSLGKARPASGEGGGQ